MNKKKIVIVLIVSIIMIFNFTNVTGFGEFNVEANPPTMNMNTSENAVERIWGTVRLILQVLAITAFILAGVRYMFASADAKADIKKQTIMLIIGAVLVFGAITVIQFITSIASDITMGSSLKFNADGTVKSRISDYDGDGIDDWRNTTDDPNAGPDIENPNVMDPKYLEMWKADHPDDPKYK